jgi:hypothetical protein
MSRALAATALAASLAAAAGAGEGAGGILTESSYWRWYVTLQRPTYREGSEVKPLTRKLKWGEKRIIDQLESPAPPADWAQPGFDDSRWPRSRLDWCRWLAFSRFSTAVVCLRGRFTVANPAGADLRLAARYIGGMVVYLNGQEVHRADMPPGATSPTSYADPYEEKHYVDSGGGFPSMRREADAQKLTRMRERSVQGVRLPRGALKPGVNVLAVELHRSPYAALCTKWFVKKNNEARWPHLDLGEIRLTCAGGGAVPNVSRPSGVQVWVQDRNDRITVGDYGDPNEKDQRVRIVGARGGAFCGQLVVGSSQPLAGVKVTASDLKGPGGGIPAKNVTVLYGLMNWESRRYGAWAHGLTERPPGSVPVAGGGGAVLPVLLRVRIPADAEAGEYRGDVSVSAGGKSTRVPAELYVAEWKVPDPKEYRTYMGIYQSPTSLAMKYKVKPWSEEHWKLIEASFALLGRVGNNMVTVDVVDETQFGSPQGMVTWIRKEDGSYDYDYSILDRYLKLAVKHCGKQDYVCLQIWHAGGWSCRPADNKCTVQVLDRKTGERSSMQVPPWGKPQAVAFWKPFLAKTRERLAELEMPGAMTVGILSCSTAPNEVFQTISDAWPGGEAARWHRGCHVTTKSEVPYKVSKVGNNTVSLHEHCYGMSMVGPGVEPLPAFHEFRGRPGTAYFRVSGHEHATTLVSYRTMAERGVFCGKQGIGRICLDFFEVMEKARGRVSQRDIYNRYPHSSCDQRQPTLKKLVWAAPGGPATTMRYEALCEGLQECEALLVLSRGAAKAGGELAGKCEKCIRDHLWYCHTRNQHRWAHSYVHMNHEGWQELSRRTFDLAAEVAEKLGK